MYIHWKKTVKLNNNQKNVFQSCLLKILPKETKPSYTVRSSKPFYFVFVQLVSTKKRRGQGNNRLCSFLVEILKNMQGMLYGSALVKF